MEIVKKNLLLLIVFLIFGNGGGYINSTQMPAATFSLLHSALASTTAANEEKVDLSNINSSQISVKKDKAIIDDSDDDDDDDDDKLVSYRKYFPGGAHLGSSFFDLVPFAEYTKARDKHCVGCDPIALTSGCKTYIRNRSIRV